jgi:hypothetical protein
MLRYLAVVSKQGRCNVGTVCAGADKKLICYFLFQGEWNIDEFTVVF